MDNLLTTKLIALGLSETEAKLYQVGLAFGKSTGVVELQKQTDLKRPTIYHALDTLMAKGLVGKVAAGQRQLFTFTAPSQLQRLVESEMLQTQRKLRQAILLEPVLSNLQIDAGSTVVGHYEGTEGVKAVVDMALYCKSGKWDILAPKQNFFSEFDERFAKYFMITRKRHKIVSRSLWERKTKTSESPTGRGLDVTELKIRNPRYLPDAMSGKFSSTMIIFDDKVAIISSVQDMSAILITSKELSQFFATLFEGLWSVSEPYTKKS